MTAERIQWPALRRAARLQEGEGRRLSLSVLLGAAAVLAGVGLLTTSGYLISRAAQRPQIIELTAVVTAVQGFGIARAVARYGERLASHSLALGVLSRLRVGFYATVAPLGRTALGGHRRGDLLARFVADVDSLQDLYLRALAPPLVAALVVAAAGVTAGIMLPVAGIALLICLLACGVTVPLLSAAAAAKAGRRQAAARAALASELIEALEGSLELAVAGRGRERVARITQAGDRLTRLSLRDGLAAAGATTLSACFTGLTLTVVLLVAIPAAHNHHLGVVYLAALAMLTLGAFEGMQPLPMAARRTRACAAAAARLQELEALTPTVRDPASAKALPLDRYQNPGPSSSPKPNHAPYLNLNLNLRLTHVSFAYEPDEPILQDVSLTFESDCRVALTGPNGAGKSTLAQLLVRFADPVAGSVSLGGIDLRELSLEDVRSHTVLIEQDAHVFTTTVRENLLLARRSATERDLWLALEVVCLDAWVRSLPQGLDTLVGEDGDELSGGQRQRLTAARGLVADAALIVLDEPTAHLDAETAGDLIANVSAAAGDRGLIVITHRRGDVAGFDLVELSERGA